MVLPRYLTLLWSRRVLMHPKHFKCSYVWNHCSVSFYIPAPFLPIWRCSILAFGYTFNAFILRDTRVFSVRDVEIPYVPNDGSVTSNADFFYILDITYVKTFVVYVQILQSNPNSHAFIKNVSLILLQDNLKIGFQNKWLPRTLKTCASRSSPDSAEVTAKIQS